MIELTEIFTRRIVSLIMHGISSSFFGMGRDLIFSFLREALFLLCMERLGYMIKEVVDSGVWSGVALGHLICSLRMMYSSSQNSSSLPPGGRCINWFLRMLWTCLTWDSSFLFFLSCLPNILDWYKWFLIM